MSAAVVIVVRVNRIMAFLRDRGAVTPEQAVALDEVPYSNRWYFRRLVAFGAVRMDGDKCYLDVEAADRYVRYRRNWALGMLVVTTLLFFAYLFVAGVLSW